jgi:hypothetical protein
MLLIFKTNHYRLKGYFMRTSILGLIALLIVGTVTSSGCSGLFLWEKGKFYHSEVLDSATLAAKDIRTVGVYAFSDGDPVEHTMVIGLSMSDWPSEVSSDASFDPDTSLAGPSLEISNAMVKQLNDRGYNATAVTDLGHNGDITVDQCLKNAQSHGYDGAFIIYYKGIKNWQQETGSSTAGNITTINLTEHDGFLYIPNATFFETKTGNQLWKNSYYGLVENAHLPNLSNQSFVKVVEQSMTDNDAGTYIEAAPKAASILLAPSLFPGTTKPFPGKGEKRHHM